MTNQPTIEDTIEALGVSDKTVRRMLKDGLLVKHCHDVREHILVDSLSIRRVAEQVAARKGDTERQHEIQLASQNEGSDLDAVFTALQSEESSGLELRLDTDRMMGRPSIPMVIGDAERQAVAWLIAAVLIGGASLG